MERKFDLIMDGTALRNEFVTLMQLLDSEHVIAIELWCAFIALCMDEPAFDQEFAVHCFRKLKKMDNATFVKWRRIYIENFMERYTQKSADGVMMFRGVPQFYETIFDEVERQA